MKAPGYVREITFSYDGRLLAIGSKGSSLQLWDAGTFQPVGHSMRLDVGINVAAINSEGDTVVTGSDDGAIQFWDVRDQSKLGAPLKGHESMITSLDFSPDGKKLLSASADGAVQVWPAPPRSPDEARDALCDKLTHNMSLEQWKKWVSPNIAYTKACPNLPIADYAG